MTRTFIKLLSPTPPTAADGQLDTETLSVSTMALYITYDGIYLCMDY
jgi:hypothetical protein